MNKEIKEILDYLKDEDEYYKEAEEVIVGYGDLIVEKEDIDKLLDYITNLQQENEKLTIALQNIQEDCDKRVEENERLKELCDKYEEEHSNEFKIWKEERHELLDYKSRCEKASDFIDNFDVFKEFSFPLMKRDIEQQIKSSIDYEFKTTFRNKLKNILQNGSDSQ